ncbi:MAG: GNAT family N-acetyltransferase [Bacteroidia bacterium]
MKVFTQMYHHKDGIDLRKVTRYDLSFLLDLKNESWWGTHHTLISNIEDQEKWFDNIPDNQLFMIAESKGVRIGVSVYTDIDLQNSCMRVSGSIAKSNRNSEIIPAAFACGVDFAFEMFNVNRIEAEVLEYHTSAQKLELDYIGFKVEGIRRNSVFKCGNYYDSLMLGLLREEWKVQDRIKGYKGCCNFDFDKIINHPIQPA